LQLSSEKIPVSKFAFAKFQVAPLRRGKMRKKVWVNTVGLCRLNQVEPLPITYRLSNP
jgi:hypothetical protein